MKTMPLEDEIDGLNNCKLGFAPNAPRNPPAGHGSKPLHLPLDEATAWRATTPNKKMCSTILKVGSEGQENAVGHIGADTAEFRRL